MRFFLISFRMRYKSAFLQHFHTSHIMRITARIYFRQSESIKTILQCKSESDSTIPLSPERAKQHNRQIRRHVFGGEGNQSDNFLIYIPEDHCQKTATDLSVMEFFIGVRHAVIVSGSSFFILPAGIYNRCICIIDIFRQRNAFV